MIKFVARLFSTLYKAMQSGGWTASLKGGLETFANVMIIGNLATKDPFIKIGETVLLVPKKCIEVAKYTINFFREHKIITIPIMVLLGFGIFKIARSQFVAEGINNARELIANLLQFNNDIDEDDKNLMIDLSSNEKDLDSAVGTSDNRVRRVEVDLFDFDKSGEVSHSEYIRGEKLVRAVRRVDRDILYVLQVLYENDLDFCSLLKRSGVYTYEKNVKTFI